LIIENVGLSEAARQLETPRSTLAVAAAGGGLRNATRLVLAEQLRRRAGVIVPPALRLRVF